jgi:hypothetical protein
MNLIFIIQLVSEIILITLGPWLAFKTIKFIEKEAAQ